MTIQVFLVDDSPTVRQVVTEVLSRESDMRLIGTAPDPVLAWGMMQRRWPDVIVLDVEMPRMDGLTFLKQLMGERPTPVVICSLSTQRGTSKAIQALSGGALAVVAKSTLAGKEMQESVTNELVMAIRAAQAAAPQLKRRAERQAAQSARTPPPSSRKSTADRDSTSGSGSFVAEKISSPKVNADVILEAPRSAPVVGQTERVVVLGISTGGVQTLEELLPQLSSNCPALAIVQHMPENFTTTFAERLNTLCKIEVREAQDKDRLQKGRALLAPGGRHMVVKRGPAFYYVEVVNGPLVTRHRPSVDVLFRSVAKCAGSNALGVIMTGMGDDGAQGLKEMRDCGAYTIAQDEESCVVFGMPKEAIRLGAAHQVASLGDIRRAIESSLLPVK